MFKKLLIASVVLAASSSIAFAHGYKSDYKGDYKGEAQVAAPCPMYVYNLTGPYIGFSLGGRSNFNHEPSMFRGVEGQLSLGYGMMMDPAFYLAAELFIHDTAKVSEYRAAFDADLDNDNSVKTQFGYGLSIIPGYLITDHVLAYMRLGVVRDKFAQHHAGSKTGGQAGLGLQTNIAPNWDLRAEYDYSVYSSAHEIGNVRADTFNVGVVYRWM